MSKYLGPKCDEQYKVNGKHKLLVVDGQWNDAEYADRFDYLSVRHIMPVPNLH